MRPDGGFRALLGGACLAACITTLGLHAPAAAQAAAGSPQAAVGDGMKLAPNLFGTIALPIRANRFAKHWARARQDASWHPALQLLVKPAQQLEKLDQIAFVQSAVHKRIRWRSDATEWGVHDHWASAVQTLERGAGDMEDRAILKMHALRLLGFPARDLYLTLGRDKVGGPMAVLIVRSDNNHFVLDDLGGKPMRAERRQGFVPMLSFGNDASWVHAVKIAKTRSSAAAIAAR